MGYSCNTCKGCAVPQNHNHRTLKENSFIFHSFPDSLNVTKSIVAVTDRNCAHCRLCMCDLTIEQICAKNNQNAAFCNEELRFGIVMKEYDKQNQLHECFFPVVYPLINVNVQSSLCTRLHS